MCGLVAVLGEADPSSLDHILQRLSHRGPDGVGLHETRGGTAVLGHTRLAIIDPDGGAQPLIAPEDGAALVANGMVYNYRELRRELENGTSRAVFRSGTDSESILHALRAHGAEAASRLDGMFAFVGVEGDRVIAGRDPIGIKPLYKGRLSATGATVLASEIKALSGLATDIEAFPAGHVWDSEAGMFRYWEVPRHRPTITDPDEAVRRIRDTLERAVVKRLRSDVPLGAFLSGGLDSSILAALAAQRLDRLHTFAIGFEDSEDILNARRVAEHIGSIHHEHLIDRAEVLERLPDIVHQLECHDRDLVRSAVPCWMVARLAAKRVKVVLTGEGADELFAGYRYHHAIDDPLALHDELRRSIAALHDMNLQRVDRMTMAHGLEARVPFLDVAMIDLAMRIHPALKMPRHGGRKVEKWVLRKAFEDLLPADVVWRDKAQFDEGSGMAAMLEREAARRGRSEAGWYRELLAARFPAEVVGLSACWRGAAAA